MPIKETEVVNELGKSVSVGYQPIEYVDGKYLPDLIYEHSSLWRPQMLKEPFRDAGESRIN